LVLLLALFAVIVIPLITHVFIRSFVRASFIGASVLNSVLLALLYWAEPRVLTATYFGIAEYLFMFGVFSFFFSFLIGMPLWLRRPRPVPELGSPIRCGCGYNLTANRSGICPECGTRFCRRCGNDQLGYFTICPECGNNELPPVPKDVTDD